MKSILTFMKRRWYLTLGIGLIILFLVWRSFGAKKETLTFVHPIQESIEETVEVSGNVTARNQAKLKFLAGGKLTYLGVSEGSEVVKNQRLASIDARDLQKNLKASLNNYQTERADLEEGRYENKDVPLSDSVMRTLNKLQWSVDNSVIDVELRNLAISNASLYSPFAGVVTSVPTNSAGMQVTAADVFEVIDPETIEFSAEVDEIDIGRINISQPVRIILDAYEDENVDSQIERVAMKATPSTKASGGTVFLVHAHLPSDYMKFRLGMNGSMIIILKKVENALTVPISSVISRDDKEYVRVKVGNNKAEEREVKTGIESDERVEIVSGLSASDEIVVNE